MAEAHAYQCPVCGAFARDQERSCRHCSTLLATLRCAHCFELSFPDHLRCRGCGAELGLGPAAHGSQLSCPDCKNELQAFQGESGILHACARCGGQMVAHGLLRALLERREALGRAAPSFGDAPRQNPLATPVRYRPCPACGVMMNRKNFGSVSGIIIDVCSLHGSFFDAGELPRVLEFVRRGGLAKAQAQQAQLQRSQASSSAPAAIEPSRAGPPWGLDGFDVVDLFTFVVDVLTSKK